MRTSNRAVFSCLSLLTILLLLPTTASAEDLIVKETRNTGPVKVLKAETSGDRIYRGRNKVVRDRAEAVEVFAGPEVQGMDPVNDYTGLIVQVSIKAPSEKKWLDLVEWAQLEDEKGRRTNLELWYFKEAYRITSDMKKAAGLGVGPETKLLFMVKEPLPQKGYRLIIGDKTVATLQPVPPPDPIPAPPASIPSVVPADRLEEAVAANRQGEACLKMVPKEFVRAAESFAKAAYMGYAPAQVNLGWCYDVSLGLRQSDGEAAKWYRMAAERGDAKGQYRLGWMYQTGRGVPKSDADAVKWYRKAADQGYEPARTTLRNLAAGY